MLAGRKFGTCLSTFANCGDRFCLAGYGGGVDSLKDMLDLAAEIDGIGGVELPVGRHCNETNVRDVAAMFGDHGLEVCMVVPDVWAQAKWGQGSLTAPDAGVRQAAVDEIRRAMDLAEQLSCPYIDFWPGQDGVDYCLQADYVETWRYLREGLAKCAAHNVNVRILIEYKPKEPRKRAFVNSAAKTLLLCGDLDNVGVLLDVGHALQGGENMAEAAALLHGHGKLDYIHLNDNYRSWDDDLMLGSVHLVEYLELAYWLERLDYAGWLTLDIYPCREDGVQAATQSREWMDAMFRAVSRVGADSFADVIASRDACRASELVRKALNL